MSNKTLAQFTEATTADQNNKWVVGYDTVGGTNREVKYKLDYFVTTDVNGNIPPRNSGTFQELIVNSSTRHARLEVSGQRNCYIDLKKTFGSDYDLRIAVQDTSAAGAALGGANVNPAIFTNNRKLEINANPLVLQDGQPNFRVGISVANPTEKLDIAGNAKASGGFIADGMDALRSNFGDRDVILRNDGPNFWILVSEQNSSNDSNYRPLVVEKATGNVWSNSRFQINNTLLANNFTAMRQNNSNEGGEIQFARSSDNTAYWANDVHGNGTDPAMRWHNRGVVRLNLDANGNLTASGDVTAFSDIRVKTNVKTISNALDKVNALRGVEYQKITTGENGIGVIAQEVEQIFPQVVTEVEGTKAVAYGNLVGVLIEAVKELTAKVNSLEAKLNK